MTRAGSEGRGVSVQSCSWGSPEGVRPRRGVGGEGSAGSGLCGRRGALATFADGGGQRGRGGGSPGVKHVLKEEGPHAAGPRAPRTGP